MEISVVIEAEEGQIFLAGEMTIYAADELKNSALFTVFEHCQRVDVDLSKVSEMDAAGLQIMVAAKLLAQAQDKQLRFINHSAAVLNVLDLCNMASHFGDPMLISASIN